MLYNIKINDNNKNEKKNDLSVFDGFDDFFQELVGRQMKTNIEENDKEYILESEIPGVKKEDISLSVKDDYLTIKVETKNSKENKNKNYLIKERGDVLMTRSFYLANVDQDNIKAKYENGILTVTLGKVEIKNKKGSIIIE